MMTTDPGRRRDQAEEVAAAGDAQCDAPIRMKDLRHELDAAGMRLDDARWVLPWLADGLLARVIW
jgi:hypothetical protein